MRRLVFVLLLLTVRQGVACSVEDADSLGAIESDIGLWDAVWAGFSYTQAAYSELGEDLDDVYGSSIDPGYYHVYYVYTVWFPFEGGGARGTNSVHVCFTLEPGQTFEEAMDDWLSDRNSDGSAMSGGIGYLQSDYNFWDSSNNPLYWDQISGQMETCFYDAYCDSVDPGL